MSDLLNVDVALQQILAQIKICPTEVIPIYRALGRVLANDIQATENLPPFANSSMDGYAIVATDSIGASPKTPITLRVTQDIPAGITPTRSLNQGEAARIMTGAPIPDGATAVIPVEQTDSQWSEHEPAPQTVQLFVELTANSNIRPIGENVKVNQTIAPAGTVIQPALIGMCAALGLTEVTVIQRPRVVIIGSGDEIVDIHQTPAPGQIRDVNSYALAALVEQAHAEAIRLPIAPDQPEALQQLFENAIQLKPDLIISSAGVSVGAADYVRDILQALGNIEFWKINIRPGKPLAYGNLSGIPFFGLPGNPVSAVVTFEVLARPVLMKLGGFQQDSSYRQAIVGETMRSDGRRTYVRVKLVESEQGLTAYETGNQSSGALISMVEADGLLIIPENVRIVEAGQILQVKLLR